MATDAFLLERITNILTDNKTHWIDKKMFGGNCFMVREKMCFATYRGGLMLKVDTEEIAELLNRSGANEMIQGGKSLKGYLFIEPEGYDNEEDLEFWIKKSLDFNKKTTNYKL